MSLFGPADDADHRRWQQRNLFAVTELIKFGVKRKLPPLEWTVPTVGNAAGKVDAPRARIDHVHPREIFEAWYAALDAHPRVKPRPLGFRGDSGQRSERTDNLGRTRMISSHVLQIPGHGACDFVLLAEWWEDDTTADVEPVAPTKASKR
ncbi:hypothetical protein [Amycolatopsis thermoflava]|uniref:hypothetical protein n=1 Tax=Amycolatopsis thermoflava TaxID=84480 RepID=UPI003F4A0F42